MLITSRKCHGKQEEIWDGPILVTMRKQKRTNKELLGKKRYQAQRKTQLNQRRFAGGKGVEFRKAIKNIRTLSKKLHLKKEITSATCYAYKSRKGIDYRISWIGDRFLVEYRIKSLYFTDDLRNISEAFHYFKIKNNKRMRNKL